jgi:hypothetical protein
MGIPKSKLELLQVTEAARGEWDNILSRIDEQALTEPGVEGTWSVKQIVAHVAGYEEGTVAFLNDRRNPSAGILAAHDAYWQGRLDVYRRDHPDFPTDINKTNNDEINAVVVATYDQYTAREVLEREQSAYRQLLSVLQELSENELMEKGTVGSKSIMEILPNQCHRHYLMHLPAIQRWLEQRQ